MRRSSTILLVMLLASMFAAVRIISVQATGTIYIRADGSIDPSTAPIQQVGCTYSFYDDVNGQIVVERDFIRIDGNGHLLEGSGSGNGIELSGRRSVSISNLRIESFRFGIFLNDSSDNLLSGNNVSVNVVCGIFLYNHSDRNTICGNKAKANFDAIYLYRSSGNTICGNALSESGEEGIETYVSSDNVINGNDVTANKYGGISLLDSSGNNTISGNNVKNNTSGIWLYSYSDNNTVKANEVAGNYQGICLESSSRNIVRENAVTFNKYDGIVLDRASDSLVSQNNVSGNYRGIALRNSLNNKIFHNNIFNNTLQASSEESSCIWDDGYPSGGNYWSDYSGRYPDALEIDASGIWDTPYIIDARNRDGFPLMHVHIIPEFPSCFFLPLFVSVIVLATMAYRTKHRQFMKKREQKLQPTA